MANVGSSERLIARAHRSEEAALESGNGGGLRCASGWLRVKNEFQNRA
jgi:hypothetical protein